MDYTHLRVRPEAAASLRELAAIASGLVKTRVTQSQALSAAIRIARDRLDVFAATLAAESDITDDV